MGKRTEKASGKRRSRERLKLTQQEREFIFKRQEEAKCVSHREEKIVYCPSWELNID